MKSWQTGNGTKVMRLLAGRSNVFLIQSEGKTILVDTGPARLFNRLRSGLKKLDIKSIDYLVITHAHFDHAANAARVREEFSAKVVIHRTEASLLEKGMNALIKGTNPFTSVMVNLISPLLLSLTKYEQCKPDIINDSGFFLPGIHSDIYLLHTPGHTDGSQSVIIDKEIACVGDAMFGVFPWSVFPPFANNTENLVKSWGKLLDTGCRLFLPSHGSENIRNLVMKEYNNRK